MAETLPPVSDAPPPSDLKTRAIVGILLIAASVAMLKAGGWWFTALVTVGVLLIYAEWAVMHRIARGWRLVGLIVLGLVCMAAQLGWVGPALTGLAIASIVLGVLTHLFRVCDLRWPTTGLLYAGLPAIALIWMRGQTGGFGFVLWTLAVVWATDIFAYFAGRNIGGPKLAPKLSPKKTWSGLVGGMAGAAIVSSVVAWFQGWHPALWLAIFAGLGATAAVLSQAGDLFESWLKRRIGVKDSGTLLPGHGGIMDRIDGLVPVAIATALVIHGFIS